MSDLGEGEWFRMLCIETSNVLKYAVELAPAEVHSIRTAIETFWGDARVRGVA